MRWGRRRAAARPADAGRTPQEESAGPGFVVEEYDRLVLLRHSLDELLGPAEIADLTRSLEADGDDTVTVVTGADETSTAALWPRLGALLDTLGGDGVGTVRLAMSGAGDDRPGRPSVAQRISDAWDIEVIAPSGTVLGVPGGGLFVRDQEPDGEAAGRTRGWWRFAPGAPPVPLGPRQPAPGWQPAPGSLPAATRNGCVVEQIPAGVLIRPAEARAPRPGDLCYAVPVDRHGLLVVLGVPDGEDVGADDVTEVVTALPGSARSALRFAPGGRRDVLRIARETAELVDAEVLVYSGLPLLAESGDRRLNAVRPMTVGVDGAPSWQPFVDSVICAPGAPSPRLGRWSPPLPGPGQALRGVVRLSDRWQVTVTRAGLWISGTGGEPPALAARPVDARGPEIEVGRPGEALDRSLWPALEKLLDALPVHVRARARMHVHGTAVDGGLELRRLAARHRVRSVRFASFGRTAPAAPRPAPAVDGPRPTPAVDGPRPTPAVEGRGAHPAPGPGEPPRTALDAGSGTATKTTSSTTGLPAGPAVLVGPASAAGAPTSGSEPRPSAWSSGAASPDAAPLAAGPHMPEGARTLRGPVSPEPSAEPRTGPHRDRGGVAGPDAPPSAPRTQLAATAMSRADGGAAANSPRPTADSPRPTGDQATPAGPNRPGRDRPSGAAGGAAAVDSRRGEPSTEPGAAEARTAPSAGSGATAAAEPLRRPAEGDLPPGPAHPAHGRQPQQEPEREPERERGPRPAGPPETASAPPSPGRAPTAHGDADGVGTGETPAVTDAPETRTAPTAGTTRPSGDAEATTHPSGNGDGRGAGHHAPPLPGPANRPVLTSSVPGAAAQSPRTDEPQASPASPAAAPTTQPGGRAAEPPAPEAAAPRKPRISSRPLSPVPFLPGHRSTQAERAAFRTLADSVWDRQAAAVARTLTRMPALRGPEQDAARADLIALLLYLRASDGPFGHRELKQCLRAGDRRLLPYAACVASALRRMPSFRGPALRGAGPSVTAESPTPDPGTVLRDPAPLSALPADGRGPSPAVARYAVWSVTGRRVRQLSDSTGPGVGHDEVVFPPGTAFRVLGVRTSGPSPLILLRELPTGPDGEPPVHAQLDEQDHAVLARLDEALTRCPPGAAAFDWPARCAGPVGGPPQQDD
ncbi:hypothetical protein [Streptomyces sp. MUM 178J]|uniref:hypothetical protein n=1 Tax=Streptomyces sp. MUM 178J TaxID=2791991 RepID=UPI001F0331EC|nr:hypothetical protein [Streptomyces sp. MUM 178J]WRQ81510.1 hypothetical protein I3F59_020350 [Streptomyces sp. MUM 178J]